MRQKQTRARKSAQDSSLPKYSIAVAADLSGVSQQQLRRLEEGGLVLPGRTSGNTRRYSDDDLDQIADVSALSDEGINAAGIRHIQTLDAEVAALRADNDDLRAQLAAQTGEGASPSSASSGSGESAQHDGAGNMTRAEPKTKKARAAS